MPSHEGRQTLPAQKRRIVFRLVDRGVSYRETARRTGCHRNTVYRLIKQRAERRRTGKVTCRRQGPPLGEEPADDLVRCPGCGALVLLPCVACAATAELSRRRAVATRRAA